APPVRTAPPEAVREAPQIRGEQPEKPPAGAARLEAAQAVLPVTVPIPEAPPTGTPHPETVSNDVPYVFTPGLVPPGRHGETAVPGGNRGSRSRRLRFSDRQSSNTDPKSSSLFGSV